VLLTNEPPLSSKGILCGAVTDGLEWIFLIFYLDKDGIGGMYKISPTIKIHVSKSYPYHILSPGPDIVAGIVAYWVCYTLFYFICPHEQMSDGTQLC
jgi:hypothetical protein